MANANTVTWSGRSVITNRIKGNGTEPKFIQWGNSAITASANPDVNLFSPCTEARTTGTSTLLTTTQLADTYQVVGTITCTNAGKAITEVGLFDSATASPGIGATAGCTITNSLTTATTVLTIGATTGLPTAGATNAYYIQVENEVMLVTAGGATTTITVTRAALGSTTAVHSGGVVFSMGGDGGAGSGGATSGQGSALATVTGGSIFGHADFPSVSLNVNDSIAFTIKDQFS